PKTTTYKKTESTKPLPQPTKETTLQSDSVFDLVYSNPKSPPPATNQDTTSDFPH
ncbi:MAG: hypothetical protein ACI8V2_005401, partial [Candidatus Latescibacterota bacterium]